MSQRAEPRHEDDIVIPRVILWAAMALVLFSLAAVFVGRATNTGLVLTPPGVAMEERALRFTPIEDGSLAITDPVSGQMVALLSIEQDGFIRGVLRGLTRGRAVTRTSGDDVYVLTRWDDGRLSITDPVTGERFDLNSFGTDNLRAFARLLPSQGGVR